MSLMLRFQGGTVGNPVSNEQAVSEIVESLGLGLGQYIGEKKVSMLSDPLKYLKDRNTALKGVATEVATNYDTDLAKIAEIVAGSNDAAKVAAAKQLLWVKRLAADSAQKKAEAKLFEVDVQYPIKDEAYKAQKSKNKRSLEEKKEQVALGAK